MKQLTLPKKIKVGENWYSVDIAESMRERLYMGEVHYAKRTITLARKSYHGIPLKLSALQETFWHELTHTILYDMGHDLCANERFVTAFANRLSDAVNSAKL